ncbi:7-carboxy-7-deazaguanine synthase QueE [Bradyrhizobium septentrionale]|uniref:7-carboxy-7-deazaguanine synthase n=1 Tax=Bradyrhizobium septentrionale TaxID=1404411 RepID=A0A973W0F5_9BRAD|nr:7-carboxy-7-deazaguanine synthase QueE [Bradyrhizobium septentrionale]UGY13752.1 7-carboxy-7-deazaguanine synthase QueE [Bradyrhizobium septentrionale]
MLPVNELFETVQGEATFTGMPSMFVRLQRCDVGCPWCDTKYTWEMDPAQVVTLADIVSKTVTSPAYASVTVDQLILTLRPSRSRHLVLTGGEPCMYDLTELSRRMIAAGWTVQVETSGTEEIRIDPRAWVTVSPKLHMPGGRTFRADAWQRANEIKMPVGKPADVETLKRCIEHYGPALVWLQPLSMSRKATELCMDAARRNGWRISIQTHKYLGVR